MTGFFKTIDSNNDCYICMLPTSPTTAVNHMGCHREGISHGRCILEWGNSQESAGRVAKCFCDKQMNMNSLREIVRIPLKERVIAELEQMKKDAYIGVIIGTSVLISCVAGFGAATITSKILGLSPLIIIPVGTLLSAAGSIPATIGARKLQRSVGKGVVAIGAIATGAAIGSIVGGTIEGEAIAGGVIGSLAVGAFAVTAVVSGIKLRYLDIMN